MSERIHVHAAPDDCQPSGWILVFQHADPIGPFSSDTAAAAWAGEWVASPCCVIPVVPPGAVQSFLHRLECHLQFPDDDRG